MAVFSSRSVSFEHIWSTFGVCIKWLLSTIFIFSALEVLYIVATECTLSRRLTVPGTTVATAIWLLISWALGFYFRSFGEHHVGSLFGLLANPIAFMLWLYWSAAAILIGAEINSDLLD